MTTSPTELPRRGRSPLVSWAGFGSSSRGSVNKRGKHPGSSSGGVARSLGASPPADRSLPADKAFHCGRPSPDHSFSSP